MGLLGSILGTAQRVQFIQNSTSTVIQLDCSLKENHSRASAATKFPVENGQTVSDHIIVSPFVLDITGIISDTPIGSLAGSLTEVATTLTNSLVPPAGLLGAAAGFALFSALSSSKSPSVAAYEQLLSLQENAQAFDVLTSLKRYSSMWITDLSAPREADTGGALLFTVKLEQLLLVTPQSVNVQIFANPNLSANQADMGEQGPNLSAKYQQGFNSATKAVHAVVPGGLAGGP